jgi:protein involved in polysaccharide export with SLBB domain
MTGKNNFSNIKLIDGDVIHIPSVKKRVYISGEVNRPHFYELFPYESIFRYS